MPTGFEKINAPCLQALADHLPYLWVDTCCIDKTSSAELSEAINSMFRWWWYRPARVCYVYLEDFEVSSVPGVTADAAIGSEKAGLGKARYFTRRWTLQELVAPRCMDFYHKNWVCFGTKGSLKSALAHVIGINKAYLSDANVIEASAVTRTSWIATRVTTKLEDIAYRLRPRHTSFSTSLWTRASLYSHNILINSSPPWTPPRTHRKANRQL
ncbi:hypothetical protein M3J09_001134 [Ascochyta lentis]